MNNEMAQAKEQLETAAQTIATLMSGHLKEQGKCVNAQFPTGVIRKLNSLYPRWPYLSLKRQRTVACAIQLCDINQFQLNLWKLRLTAGAMWEWHCTIPVVAVIETLAYEYGIQFDLVAPNSRFKKTINILQSKGVISSRLREQLHKLREYRNDIHLYIKNDDVEMYAGKPKKYNNAVRALHRLERRLAEHHAQMAS